VGWIPETCSRVIGGVERPAPNQEQKVSGPLYFLLGRPWGRSVTSSLVTIPTPFPSPFKCRVLVFDPAVGPAELETLGVQGSGSLAELLSNSDVVSLYGPSTPQSL